MLTRRRLKELLIYDPRTGIFRWRVRRSGVPIAGMVAGSPGPKGHILITINGRKYKASRLAVFWMTGRWPRQQVDHRDTDPGNDRWKNLRLATNAENCRNRSRFRNNTTGFKGVSFHRLTGKYQAAIRKDYRRIHLGLFGSARAAHEAYKAAANELFGEFARPG